MDVRFVQDRDAALRRNTDPRLKSSMILSENLTLAFMSKKEVRVNQSWAVGFTILELSKFIMQSLMYDVIKPEFGNRASVLLSDTDSWILALPTKNTCEAMARLNHIMDFSNYDSHHPLFDDSQKNQTGFLKNEMPNEDILEVVGIRSKTYAIRTDRSVDSRCKGVKQAAKKKLTFEDYKKCVQELHTQHVTQFSIQSKSHLNRLIETKKVAFSSFDDKRHLLCGIHSVPYGSVLIEKSIQMGACYFCANPTLLC